MCVVCMHELGHSTIALQKQRFPMLCYLSSNAVHGKTSRSMKMCTTVEGMQDCTSIRAGDGWIIVHNRFAD